MDFFKVAVKETRGVLEVYPDFVVGRSKDLMVRAKSFYAIWDEDEGLWSTDEYDAQRLIDRELLAYAKKHEIPNVKITQSFSTNSWNQFKKYMSQLSDNSHQLDAKLTFANTEVKKEDYVSKRLPYSLAPGDHSAWDTLVGALYSPEERAKIEWAIGAVVSGDSTKIQKFLVFYGAPGTGKGTILDIVLELFKGYTATFDAKSLVGQNNTFSMEPFKGNPLVAVQMDGDLSNVQDNTKLNMITAHEPMGMNEKHKPVYTVKLHSFLFMGSNKPVKITDAKSGLIRRLIDVHPTGFMLEPAEYHALVARTRFELGAIAQHCLEVYSKMGKNFYNSYRPMEMMYQTDIFFNFVEAHYDIFKAENGTSLRRAYSLYKEYCDDTGINKILPQYKIREELKSYFDSFEERAYIDGREVRSYYSDFTAHKFKALVEVEDPTTFTLVIEEDHSIFDLEYAEQPAQHAKKDGTPKKRWVDVKTTLAEIDTSEIHYVKVPGNHIVIDFDLKGDDGEKSLELNLEAASLWPPTYAEISMSGKGVHLHYIYDGDVSELASVYSEGIEVKVYAGNSSLRRRLTKCNNVPVLHISSGLPFKEKKRVLDTNVVKSERGLRNLIIRNMKKDIHPGTKPSIDFIDHILVEAYKGGMSFDLEDLRPNLIAFANQSTNHSLDCLAKVSKMRLKSEETAESVDGPQEASIVFYDVEVYPNLFVVCWKRLGDDYVNRMINPSSQDIEELLSFRLIGFYNRRYDNHILWGRYLGLTNKGLYELSQKIISGNVGAMFGQAYNLSYADVWDFTSDRKSLKKYQIELGITHREMDIPWDKNVPEDRVMDVVEYCVNDVMSTEAVFKARENDFFARKILAELSGLSVNDPNPRHTAQIIFGNNKDARREFVYTDLSEEFPGYKYNYGKSEYREEDPGEGGYVYAEPGVYKDVALLDVASMHPTTIINLNLFGPYTEKFKELVDARLVIKHANEAFKNDDMKKGEEYLDEARKMLEGRLDPYLNDKKKFRGLSDALKLVINTVYGLTSASFNNPFRDERNVDNIVAKRGALFMIDLKNFIQEAGFTVAHIKTDSVKIPEAPPWLIEAVIEFGRKYGYEFEHEATFSKFCLVNNAVFVAKMVKDGVEEWKAVGAQFQHPYVFKCLFDPGPHSEDNGVTFDDLCETKQVDKGAIYMDFTSMEMPENHPEELHFVGRVGRFVPVNEGYGGATLWRIQDGKSYAVAGTKGRLWVDAEVGRGLPPEAIDMSYFEKLADTAVKTIEKFGDFEELIS